MTLPPLLAGREPREIEEGDVVALLEQPRVRPSLVALLPHTDDAWVGLLTHNLRYTTVAWERELDVCIALPSARTVDALVPAATLPAFVIVRDGEVTDTLSDCRSAHELNEWLKEMTSESGNAVVGVLWALVIELVLALVLYVAISQAIRG